MILLGKFNQVYLIERILSAGTYISAGFVGFIWLVIATLMKKRVSSFLMYHIMQSIFLSIAYFLFIQLLQLVFGILVHVAIFYKLWYLLMIVQLPIYPHTNLINTIAVYLTAYLTITSFCGLYSYLPWISGIINRNR